MVGIGIDERTALVIENDRYRVYGDGAVWLYRVGGPVELMPGTPLELGEIDLARLLDGAEGPWPAQFDGLETETLRVEAGQVVREGGS